MTFQNSQTCMNLYIASIIVTNQPFYGQYTGQPVLAGIPS